MSADSDYKTVLAEVRERLVKYVNKLHGQDHEKLFTGEPSVPPVVPITYSDITRYSTTFFRALVLLLGEQEMRLRNTELTLAKIEAFARELLVQIKKEVGEDKLDALIKQAQEKSKGEAN